MVQEPRDEGRWHGIDVRTLAAGIVCVAAALLGVWLVFRYALGIALPFLLAYLLSLGIRPLVKRLTRRRHIPRWLVAGVLVTLFVGVVVCLVVWGCSRAVSELGRLVTWLGSGESGVGETVQEALDWVRSLSEHLPFLKHFEETPGFEAFCEQLDTLAREAASRLLSEISSRLPGMAMALVGSLPSAFLFITVLLLSCYYFSADDGSIGRTLSAMLPAAVREKLPDWRARGRALMRRYIRAYLILGLITFVEMFIGLSVIGIPYAFLLSWIIAIVDFLPVFGAGTVLLPWSAVLLVTGQYHDGLGLLILYGVTLLVRQFAEPRLISASLGLHPVASLLAMYAGWRLFGVVGLIAAPLIAMTVKGFWKGADADAERDVPGEGVEGS